ncbi:MAG: MiaB/RimO family radical SAM methylthiotransferase [Candidatus Omnitrophota bacterium]|nr:MAG: MiaB/RimO family radical SAM methylthiotransferase [Candidatus Omnitrophota bacterium]
MSKKTFSIVSLGCFRNLYDSEIVAKRFLRKGFLLNPPVFTEEKYPRILIINTCGFIDKAKEESLEAIRQAIDLKKKAKIEKLFVFGCLIQRYRGYLEKFFPQVDEWWGIERFSKKFTSRQILSASCIGFLKICEGCLHKCSYCAIPLIKGSLISKPRDEVIKEVKFLEKRGVRELNIIGQDITSWGKDLERRPSLADLVRDILGATKNIRWIRLIYTHPRYFTSELIDLIADEARICKYVDLPIQHISDRILKLMNRTTTKSQIIRLIERIRTKIPGSVIRTSLIVGFPTEKEKEFGELLRFVKEIRFDRLGVFAYSREEQTPAAKLRQVHPSTKKRRFKELMALQKDIALKVNGRFIGKDVDVLVEEKNDDILIGRTQYDAPQVDGVVFLKKKDLRVGSFYRTKIVDAYEYDLVGE